MKNRTRDYMERLIDFSEDIASFRAHIPVADEWAYLESASTGLIPDFVYAGVRRYVDDRFLKGGDSVWVYNDESTWTLPMIERSKEAIAEMINCSGSDITFGQSSTQLFTMVTEGIDYLPGENVVAVQQGWIGNRYAWQKKSADGLEVRFVYPENGEITVDAVTTLCDENTRAVTVNLVESKTGYLIDIDRLGEYCRKNSILLFVDAVQALGALKVDVQKSKIDFMVGTDYKWMMNMCGTGYAYVSPKVRNLVKHWGAGWMSDTDRFNTSKDELCLRDDAGRFEIGHQHNDGIYGLGLVAMQNNIIGMDVIEEYVKGLGDYCRKRIRETDGVHLTYEFENDNCCHIVSIEVERSNKVTNEDFAAAKVFTHIGAPGENGCRNIRVGFHYYNNTDDIDRLIDVLNSRRG